MSSQLDLPLVQVAKRKGISLASSAKQRRGIRFGFADKGIEVRSTRIGGAGSQITAGTILDDDQNADLRNEKWYGEPQTIGISRKMERDPHVSQSLTTKRAPLIAALWDFEPASKKPVEVEAASYMAYLLFERSNWFEFLTNATLYMRDGSSLIEETDDVSPIPADRFPLHPGKGTGVVITGLHRIPTWSVKYWHQRQDDPTKLDAITQYLIGSDNEKPGWNRVPADRLIRFTMGQEGANFAGLSYLRRAYGAWKVKQTCLLLDAMRHDRYGIDTPTIKLPENATEEDFDQAQTILSELRAHEKGYLALPFGYEFKWEGGQEGAGSAIGETIERCNRDILFSVGAGFTLLGLQGATGSYGLAQSQQGQYEIQLEIDAKLIANTINFGLDGWSIVERMVRLNYGEGVGLPRLVARNMPTKNWAAILPVIHNLTLSKHITPSAQTEAFIRSAVSLPQLEDDKLGDDYRKPTPPPAPAPLGAMTIPEGESPSEKKKQQEEDEDADQ